MVYPFETVLRRYMYAWASEVFATICAAIFFPVNLEQLARENGVYAFDRYHFKGILMQNDTMYSTFESNFPCVQYVAFQWTGIGG